MADINTGRAGERIRVADRAIIIVGNYEPRQGAVGRKRRRRIHQGSQARRDIAGSPMRVERHPEKILQRTPKFTVSREFSFRSS